MVTGSFLKQVGSTPIVLLVSRVREEISTNYAPTTVVDRESRTELVPMRNTARHRSVEQF